jgi:hypothetical protein
LSRAEVGRRMDVDALLDALAGALVAFLLIDTLQ